MKANVISSPTFRYLQGNKTDVEFVQIDPKPWSNIDDESQVSELNEKFKDKKIGISQEAIKLNKEKVNSRYVINVKQDTDVQRLNFDFSKEKDVLVDDIKIQAEKDTKSSFIIDYKNLDEEKSFRNSVLYVYAKENAVVDIHLISRQNNSAKIWQSVGIVVEENAKVNLYQVELGLGEKLFACHGNVMGRHSKLNIETSYFLEKEQFMDILYNIDIYGIQSETDIVVNGIQKDLSKKIFKGTLDFKRGAKASSGSEEEYVTLLDKTVRSKSLPIILCGEENITGNHAASAGQIDENMLFYIMSRGFSRQEAISLIVEARLVPVIDKLPDKKLRDELLLSLRNKMTGK